MPSKNIINASYILLFLSSPSPLTRPQHPLHALHERVLLNLIGMRFGGDLKDGRKRGRAAVQILNVLIQCTTNFVGNLRGVQTGEDEREKERGDKERKK